MSLNTMTIAKRLPLAVIVPALIIALLVGLLSFFSASSALDSAAKDLLVSTQAARQDQLTMFFTSLTKDMQISAGRAKMVENMRNLAVGYAELGPSAGARLRELYVTNNPNPAGERAKLADAGDGSAYSTSHIKANAMMSDITKRNGYYDLFLVNPQGDVLYSVAKEQDFTSNLVQGEGAGTGLGQAVQAVLANPVKDFVAFANYAPYAPSGGTPASFLASPILDPESKALLGVLAIQLPTR